MLHFQEVQGHQKILTGQVAIVLAVGDWTQVDIKDGRGEVVLLSRSLNGLLLLASTRGIMLSCGNASLKWAVLPVEWLAKLQFFIDKCEINSHEERYDFAAINIPCQVLETRSLLEQWFIQSSLIGEPEQGQLAGVLRRMEAYNLVKFVFDHRACSKLSEMREEYGLSETHFRALGKKILGCGVKCEIRKWRAMQAMFDLIDRDASHEDVALRHKYDSGSHLSRDVKKLIGVTPRKILLG